MFELNLIGSDEVVIALNEMMQHIYRAENLPSNPIEMLSRWGRLLIPNPPVDTDRRREDSGRGVRKLQKRWSGLEFG